MKFRILLKSFDSDLIKVAGEQLSLALMESECAIACQVALPTRIKKFCVLRSPHVNKDSREHFELRVHKRFVDFILPSSSMLASIANIELVEGVLVSIKLLTQ